ncbi:MAG TPA: Crp/Fnr family transcriptional regulator [Pyrinomonadaceae bacterium]|jgi:CRP-like cAMP-binding protein
MSSTGSSLILTSNQILSALPRQRYPLLFSHLRPVTLARGDVIYDLAGQINYAFFIMSGMVSLLATTEDGSTTQVGMVGDEGMVGIPAILKISKAPYQVTVQIPGRAMRVRSEILVTEFAREGPLQDILLRYVHSLLCQISQSAACNRFHRIEQRLCRWLLISRDHVKSDDLQLTQEALSHMLGATRTNVTKAATALKDAGLIQYHRGNIHIINRPAMVKLSCECYRVITQEIGAFRAA